jgi:MFS family permease
LSESQTVGAAAKPLEFTSRQFTGLMVGATLGSLFEWYDFFLAATAAAAVWPAIFFPARFDPALALAISVATVGIAYFGRPAGAFVFGHFGDRYGRRSTMVWTLIVMGVSSIGTALLPPYASWGMISVAVLFFLRFLVGFAVGGESGGAFTWILEARPNSKHRGFWISWTNAVLLLGKVLGIFAFYLASTYLSRADYLAWGWRLTFAVGALLVVIGMVVRAKILESPLFRQLQARRSVLKYPAVQVLKEEGRKLFTLLWLDAWVSLLPALVALPYSVSYLVKLGVSESFATLSVTWGTGIAVIPVLGGAFLSDYIGRVKMQRVGAILSLAFLYPYFLLLNSLNWIWIIVAQAMIYCLDELPTGSNKALYAESFSTKYRYSGSSLSYQLGSMLTGIMVGVLLPFYLVAFGVTGAWLPIVLTSAAMIIIALVATFFVKETRDTTIE